MMQLTRESKKIEIEGGADEFQILVHKNNLYCLILSKQS